MMRYNKKPSKYRLFVVIALLVGLVFPAFFSFARDKAKVEKEETNVFTYTGKDGVVHELKYSSDEVFTAVVNKDGVQEVVKYNPKEGNIIVQLEDNPIIKYVKKGESLSPEFLTTITNQLQASHQQLKQDIADIEGRIGLPPGETSTTIKREYFYVFNGLALRTDRKVIKEIKALPYVLEVFPDLEVKTCLTESVPLINADDVWGMGYTGTGITIGIIDTGIDYTHPDLGGGFGPGYKVIGGYDFVNNDNDPMDDHYHGTHVAGIAAANGNLEGVAPNASLVAYKVLSDQGTGNSSNIIAAIDRACDPDQDPQTDDALDVINLSLGGQGDPDDPVCQAIDNASGAGVICVCAAGNQGSSNRFRTILSPGCAREAITVGAADKYSHMAYFSSKGPSNEIYAIKPDLVAPGVDIESTAPSNSQKVLDGTSMAAPHVAGAAALLRQRFANHSPQDIKSILMGSAIDLGESVFVQGTGMVDVYAAAWLKTIVSPASISLGWDDPAQPVFSKVETLQITNTGPVQRTYSLSITLPGGPGGVYPQPGITAEISPANFTLAANETRDLTFTITVDNSKVPNGTEGPGSYEGNVVIQTPAKTIKIPFAFIKIPKLEITFDEEPFVVLIHNRTDQGWAYSHPGTYISKLLLEGIYDVMVLYYDCVTEVVREGINLAGNMSLFINKSEAIYTANITTIDENGGIIDPYVTDADHDALMHKSSQIGWLNSSYGWAKRQFHFSPLSTDYAWDWSTQFLRDNNEKLYSFNCSSDGVNSDLTFENQPEDLKQVDYKYHVDPGVNEIFTQTWIGPTHGYIAFSCQYWDRQLTDPFTQKAYYMPIPYPDFNFGGHMQNVYKYENSSIGDMLYQTAIYTVENDPGLGFDFIRGYSRFDNQTPVFQTTSGYLDIGLSPYWFGVFTIWDEIIYLRSFAGRRLWLYLNQAGDLHPHYNHGYQLYHDGSYIQGNFDGIGVKFMTEIELDEPGVYTLIVPYTDYYVKDLQGAALMSATFDTTAGDKNPPYMSHFNILCEGRPTNTVGFGKKASIKFKVYDDNGLGQVSLYYSTGGPWFPLALTNSGNQYTAPIPQFPVRTYVSLKIVANDSSGNNLTYELNPAFFIKPTPLNLFQTNR